MSKHEVSDLEDKNAVVITPEDCAECEKFYSFFEIPVPPALKAAFDAFKAEPNLGNQNELKFQLADSIVSSLHPVFQDEVFAQIRPETQEVRDGLAFERQLEATLTSTAD